MFTFHPLPTLSELQSFVGKKVTDGRSPAGAWLGFTLQSVQQGLATATVLVRPEMTNPYGNIHGGMMSLIADEIIGWAVLSLEAGHYYTSINLSVDFLYAAPVNTTLTATATIMRHGKKIINVQVEIKNADGALVATAHSNLVAIRA